MEFLRYEEVPSHLAQKVVDKAHEEEEVRRAGATLHTALARTRDIRTNQSDLACDICGRTLLRGEHAETFLAGGSRRQVCDLCTARAQHEGSKDRT